MGRTDQLGLSTDVVSRENARQIPRPGRLRPEGYYRLDEATGRKYPHLIC